MSKLINIINEDERSKVLEKLWLYHEVAEKNELNNLDDFMKLITKGA